VGLCFITWTAGIRRVAEEMGIEAPRITAAIRSGDTPAAERAATLRKPPHILVTTPGSLYLLLTAERSRSISGRRGRSTTNWRRASTGNLRSSHLLSTSRAGLTARRHSPCGSEHSRDTSGCCIVTSIGPLWQGNRWPGSPRRGWSSTTAHSDRR
jgi:hypothetical protein